MAAGTNDPGVPIEVSLVEDVKSCRTCTWFWGGVPPYGPYPSFDWTQTYPPRVRQALPQSMSTEPIRWLDGRATGYALVDPAVIRGCRKAPIMTIGINPNLTSFFPSTSGARWAYPHFSEAARYAYYYRHCNIFQESFELDLVRANCDPNGEVKAEADGWLLGAARGMDHRYLELEVLYKGQDTPTVIELAWTPLARYVVLVERTWNPDKVPPTFSAGDVIAARLRAPEEPKAQILANGTGYYQRFIPILDRFKKMAGGSVGEAALRVGEDVSQHDMIACASPGWSSAYDIPTDRITANCVKTHAHVVSQLVQSQPAILVIVGGSSLSMFAEVFGPWLELDWEGKDIYQLLEETTRRRRYLNLKVDDFELRSRLVLSPHFSYSDNFYEQSRFSPLAWQAFEADFANDHSILEQAGLVQPPAYNGVVAVRVDADDTELENKLSAAGWNVLMAYHYDPYQMIASVLAEEYEAGTFGFDEDQGHLRRATGPCRYCDNAAWHFPEGCPYGNDTAQPYPPGFLEGVVQQILRHPGSG